MSQLFSYQGNQVRTVTDNGETRFVAKDICAALGIDWSGKTLKAIPDEWQSMGNFPIEGRGMRRAKLITEPAVYKLAFRSNKPEADKFTNWVAAEVLPALRKTGKYERKSKPKALPQPEAMPMPKPDTNREKFVRFLGKVEALRAQTDRTLRDLAVEGAALLDDDRFGTTRWNTSSIIHDWLLNVVPRPLEIRPDFEMARGLFAFLHDVENLLPKR